MFLKLMFVVGVFQIWWSTWILMTTNVQKKSL